jgi:flagellar capping protein FliD
LRNFSTKLVSSTGEIATKIKDFEAHSADYTDQLVALDKSIARTRARYTTQFVNMEKAIAGLNDTKAGLENMMEAWKGSMK